MQLGADLTGELFIEGFGSSVSLSLDGSVLAVGSSTCGNTAQGERVGTARVFKFDGSQWQQLGADVSDPGGECTGVNVELSGDGSTLFNPRGASPVYRFNGTDWQAESGNFGVDSWNIGDLSRDGRSLLFGRSPLRAFRFNDQSWEPMAVGVVGDDPVLANAQFGQDDLTVVLASRALGSDGGARVLRLQSSFRTWANDVFAAVR